MVTQTSSRAKKKQLSRRESLRGVSQRMEQLEPRYVLSASLEGFLSESLGSQGFVITNAITDEQVVYPTVPERIVGGHDRIDPNVNVDPEGNGTDLEKTADGGDPNAFAPFGAAIGLNFEGVTSGQSGFIPPDTMGAVGPDHVVELVNGGYRVFNNLDGSQLASSSLDAFWNAAGVNPISFSFDPRVLYDPGEGRFYASSVDNAQQNNRILVAVSDSANPLDGWTGFAIDSDSSNGRWADFPQMSYDADGVYIGVNMFDIAGGPALSTERSTLVLPLSDLLFAESQRCQSDATRRSCVHHRLFGSRGGLPERSDGRSALDLSRCDWRRYHSPRPTPRPGDKSQL